MRVRACSYSRISASWLEWKSTRWNSSGSAPIACMKVSARSISLAELLVAAADRRGPHEVGVPGVHLPQVGVATGDERTHEVQRRGRGVVDLDQPLRVGDPRLRGEVEAVDRVAAVGRQRDAVAGLGVGGARLGVLPGEPAELDHRDRGGVGQHDGHLQQHPELVADVVGGDAVEGLGAVAALEQERLAPGHRGELGLELVALAGEHQRRHAAQLCDRGVERVAASGQPAAGRHRGRAGLARSGTGESLTAPAYDGR